MDRSYNLQQASDGMYYYYKKERMSFADAKTYCGEPGFHFPVIMTSEQYAVVKAFFDQLGRFSFLRIDNFIINLFGIYVSTLREFSTSMQRFCLNENSAYIDIEAEFSGNSYNIYAGFPLPNPRNT